MELFVLQNTLYIMYVVVLRIIWRAALSSSHYAMRCCHRSVNNARSRLMAEK